MITRIIAVIFVVLSLCGVAYGDGDYRNGGYYYRNEVFYPLVEPTCMLYEADAITTNENGDQFAQKNSGQVEGKINLAVRWQDEDAVDDFVDPSILSQFTGFDFGKTAWPNPPWLTRLVSSHGKVGKQSGVQLFCNGGGMYIDTRETASCDSVLGGGCNDWYSHNFDRNTGPSAFFHKNNNRNAEKVDLVVQADIAIARVKVYDGDPNDGSAPAGQVAFLMYFWDKSHPDLAPVVIVVLTHGTYDGADGPTGWVWCDFCKSEDLKGNGGVPFYGNALVPDAQPYNTVGNYTGSYAQVIKDRSDPNAKTDFFRAQINAEDFKKLIKQINEMLDNTMCLPGGYSENLHDYILGGAGIITEVVLFNDPSNPFAPKNNMEFGMSWYNFGVYQYHKSR